MSTNFTGSEPDITTAPSDSLFAATPVWDRATKKKRGFGSKAAKPAATVAVIEPLVETRPIYVEKAPTADQIAARELRAERLRTEPMMATTAGVEAPLMAAAPVYATKPAKKSNMAPLAVGAGILVLGGLAAAGWYATRDDGVTTLTPGATSTAALETATTPITPAPAPTELAVNEQRAPAATQTTTTVRTETPARRVTASTTRTRPAPAASATDAGVNTAATIPGAPMPYSATTGDAANTSATAPTTVNPSNFTLTPAPAPAAAEPSATPSTTPDASVVPPTATPPVASDPTP